MHPAQDCAKTPRPVGRPRRYWPLGGQLALLATLLQSGQVPAAPSVSLAVVVNPATPVQTLGSAELASVFTRARRTWDNGMTVRPLNLQIGSPERVEFDQVVLEMSPERSAKFWIDRQVRGEEAAPKAIAQADIVVSLVGTMIGSIGYIPENKVSDKVRVVARIRGGRLVAP